MDQSRLDKIIDDEINKRNDTNFINTDPLELSFDISVFSCPQRIIDSDNDHHNKSNPIITKFEATISMKSDKLQNKANQKSKKNKNQVGIDQLSDNSNNPISQYSIHRLTAPQKHFNPNRSQEVPNSDCNSSRFKSEGCRLDTYTIKPFIQKIFTILSLQALMSGIMIAITYSNNIYRSFLENNFWLVIGAIIVSIAMFLQQLASRKIASKQPYNFVILSVYLICFSFSM